MEQIQVLRIWCDRFYPKTMKEFEQIIKQWKRETKSPRVTIEMDLYNNKGSNMGRVNAMRRKWGFSPVSIVLERRK